MNKDGKLDVITANSMGNSVSVLAGNGAGTFAPVAGSPFAMGAVPNHVVAVDLDNDGKLDLVTANTGVLAASVGINVRKGDGQGGFGSGPSFTLLAQVPTHITSADFNLDGNADVAVSHAAASFTYLTGKGTLVGAPFNAAATVMLSTTMGTSIIAAPFNTDSSGLPDVVTTSTNTNNLSISINSCQ